MNILIYKVSLENIQLLILKKLSNKDKGSFVHFVQSSGAVEYTDCTSAEG